MRYFGTNHLGVSHITSLSTSWFYDYTIVFCNNDLPSFISLTHLDWKLESLYKQQFSNVMNDFTLDIFILIHHTTIPLPTENDRIMNIFLYHSPLQSYLKSPRFDKYFISSVVYWRNFLLETIGKNRLNMFVNMI